MVCVVAWFLFLMAFFSFKKNRKKPKLTDAAGEPFVNGGDFS